MTPTKCATCGKQTMELAQVSDPFLDSCYGVCQECMAYLHGRWGDQLEAALAEQAWRSPE